MNFKNMFFKKTFRIAVIIICITAVRLQAEDSYNQLVQVDRILQTQVDAAGRKIEYPTSGVPELTGVVVTIPVGASTGWHVHTVPCVAYVEQGEVTVERKDGTSTRVKAGEAFAEVVNLLHNGTNTGKVPTKIILFALGTQGTPIAIKQPTN